MEKLAEVFRIIANLYRIRDGRRRMTAELMYRARLSVVDDNAAQYAPMAPRKLRRARIRELRKLSGLKKKQARENFVFRPVYGYKGPGAAKS